MSSDSNLKKFCSKHGLPFQKTKQVYAKLDLGEF